MQDGPPRSSILLLVIVAVAGLVIRIQLINASMPYVGHIDETQLTDPAVNILKTGDLNPHMFEYPSLPVYMIAAAFTVGYFHACATSEMRNTGQIGSVTFPYYAQRKVVRPARVLFATLSVLALAGLGGLAVHICTDAHALFLAPLVLSVSTTYLMLSWRYLNVDVVGSFFVLAAVLYVFNNLGSTSSFRRAIAPGALCGLALASKYNLFSVAAPCMLAIWLYGPGRRLSDLGLLIGSMVGTFLLVVPYALLDFSSFLNDTGAAIHHYASGHTGFNADPGFPQLEYYLGALSREFGWFSPWLAVVGLLSVFATDWRKGLLLASFPVSHLTYMSMQRVHFLRNIAPVYLFFALLVAAGLLAVRSWLATALSRRSYFSGRRRTASTVATLMVGLSVLPTLPWARVVNAYDLRSDSRKTAVRWIEQNIRPGKTLIVAKELSMDTGSLRRRYDVLEVPFRGLDLESVAKSPEVYWLVPRFGHDPRSARGKAVAESLNERFGAGRFEVLERFGASDVLVNYPEPVPAGNPAFSVARRNSS